MAYSRIGVTLWIKGDQEAAETLLRKMLASAMLFVPPRNLCILTQNTTTVDDLREIPDALARRELNGGQDVFKDTKYPPEEDEYHRP